MAKATRGKVGWQACGLEQAYEDPPHVVLLKRCPSGFADRRRGPCTLPILPDLTFPEYRRIEGPMLRFRQMCAWFACLLFAVIAGLPVLAYASPPDPSWGHGLYDDADFDDIVCLIMASSGLVEDISATSRSPHFTLIDAELPPNERSIVSSSLTSPPPRAPPAS